MSKRNTKIPCPSSLERCLLEKSRHASVDFHLKALKSFSRHLNLALDAFRDDHKILERLYYKGKNQHRLSLFWRRVSETRRFCQRLNEMHIDQVVDLLRKSFFSDGVSPPFDRRATKGSWTHIPDRPFATVVFQKLNMCTELVMRMQERLLEAHRSFTLAMQTGAFLQLILTLIAAVSRIRMVCEVLQSILQSISDITRLIIDLSPVTPPSILPEDPIPSVEVSQGDKMGIDPVAENSSTPKSVDGIDLSNSTIHGPASTIINHDAPSSATLDRKDGGRKMKKRLKRVEDEIDDIFGF